MIIFVDVDETICYYKGLRNYEDAIPYPDRIYKINDLYEQGHIIIYWTARGTLTGINHFHLTQGQLMKWGAKYTELRMGKPSYDLFIDDKNINSETYFSQNGDSEN